MREGFSARCRAVLLLPVTTRVTLLLVAFIAFN
jgi:hypothetical protein